MIGFVIVIIMFAIIFALIGISYRNDFIVRKEDINKCRSNERLKRQQYLDAAKRVKALAKELGPSNIRVNAIAPGIMDTDMNRHLSEEEIEQIKNEIPLEKVGIAEDIAKCVEWLVEDNYTTGQIIGINGGWNI